MIMDTKYMKCIQSIHTDDISHTSIATVALIQPHATEVIPTKTLANRGFECRILAMTCPLKKKSTIRTVAFNCRTYGQFDPSAMRRYFSDASVLSNSTR